MGDQALTSVAAAELLGYDDLTKLPESTGTEKLVLKRGNLFAVTGRLGDIFPAGARDQGAYFEDTRFLSTLKLTVAGGPPVVLSTQGSAEYTSQIDLTVTSTLFGGLFADPVNFLHLRREQLMDDQFVERLTLTNFLVHEVDYWVEYEFAADFADQFEVRGARRRERGTYFRPQVGRDRVVFAYQGRDGVVYRSEVFFPTRAPDEASAGKARFTDWEGRRVISAGVPWYASPFGRDALITGFQALPVNPEVARDALFFLAAHQGKRVDDFREEEPGKILHEIRRGEMARGGEVPHTPYYGSVDSTPLFVILYSEYLQWTDDRATADRLLPAAEAALRWIDEYGDKDGDGFVEYERKTPRGLVNQGWKDSRDGVPHADGTPARPPIALVEVQCYCFDARRRMARRYRQLGRRDDAARCTRKAIQLARRIDEAFWDERTGTYVLALDGEKKQVRSIASNMGHLLWSRAIPDAKARRVARALLSAEGFNGWGIRTLARGQKAYNPLSYHNGTVWPHDNSLIAMGLSHYGMQHQALQILSGAYAAARGFRHYRLPELFCGMERGDQEQPVSYPVSCSPQTWASGTMLLLLRACLGLYPDEPRRTVRLVNPQLPEWASELTLRGMRIANSRVSLHFTRTGQGCFAAVTETQGDPLALRIEVGAGNPAA